MKKMKKITFYLRDKDWHKLKALAKTAKDKNGNPVARPPSVTFVAKDIILGILDEVQS